MSKSNWTIVKGYLQGDISYELRKVLTTPFYVELEMVAFGQKWKEFDIAFEYRANDKEQWKDDAVIIETTANYLVGNKLYGISASKNGDTHTIKWKYSDNNIVYSSTPQIRIRFLPRLRSYGAVNNSYSITSLYGESLINLDGLSNHYCIGINNDGNYMCIKGNTFYIVDSLDVAEPSSSSTSYVENWSSSSSSDSSSSSSSYIANWSSSSSSSIDDIVITVTGTISPDATGTYYYDGLYNGHRSWKHQSASYYIWWIQVGIVGCFWNISNAKGNSWDEWWTYSTLADNDPRRNIDLYEPFGTYTGYASVN